MKYLSWDIGIKNLSYCMMDKELNVLFWEVIDITGEVKEEKKCIEIQKNKKICNKNANFYNFENGKFYCKKHCKDFKENMIDINKITCSHRVGDGKICGKKISFETDNKYIGYCKTHSKKYENLKEIKKIVKEV